jgi:PAS domain S-box-containing protein
VVDLTKERFGLYHAHIYLLAEDRSSLNLVAGAGETGRAMVAEGWSIPLEQERSLVARAARRRQGVIVNDVRQEPDWLPNPLLPDTRAEMAVPIIVGDQVLGVLDVQSDVTNRFMDEDVRIQTTLAGQIGVALRNARLYEQIQTALQETQQSQRLLQSVINATPDWIFIKDQEYRYRLVNQGYANALHLNPEDFIGKNDLELGFPEELVKGSPEKGIRGFWTDDRQVMDSGEPLVNPYDPATIDGEVHIFHTIKAPVRDAAGNVTGALAFARDVTGREQILAETEAMYKASRRLSAAANLQEVTAAVAEGVRVPAINRAVLLAAEQNSAGEIEALAVIANWHSGSETSPIPVGAHYPRSMLESVKLLLTPEPLFFDDVQNDQRINPAELDLLLQQRVRCLAVLPLRTGGRQLGVLLLQGEKPHHFTENESRSYPTLVGQMAIAVENQRLLGQARARVRYEQLLRETTARVHSATDITFVMRTAVREIGQLLGRPTYIYLAHQEQLQTDETLKEK